MVVLFGVIKVGTGGIALSRKRAIKWATKSKAAVEAFTGYHGAGN
jgi:hypothetical protein